LGLASVLEIPFARACALAVPAVLALGGYFFAERIVSTLESAVSAVRAAAGHPSVERPHEPAGFPKAKRDQLDEIMGEGIVQGEPGYLVLRETPRSPVWTSREGKFPYPWELDTYLDRADRIRRVFVA